jgi:osmoprotectant transport system permease protein
LEFLASVAAWFGDPSHWQGPDGIPQRLLEHVAMSGISVLVATLVALPAGLLIGHTGRGATLVVNLANTGRAVPSYAILVMVFPLALQAQVNDFFGFGFGSFPTFAAMTLLAIPPIVTNTYVALRSVDADLLEAARGMGMRGDQILRRIEMPLGLPVILAGLRTAAVQVVATATLGAVIGWGGLGRYIVDGIARRENDLLFAGAVLVALLAIATELAFGLLQRWMISPGLTTAVPRALTESGQAPTPAGMPTTG